ncbi:MAG TPA: glycoside hydrolase family 3 C-terminal domain-containing protein [Polyangiales bacterium]|nr:glycoside hydrolase family 3 C-terminal domain-containing protein [Polyangiales bacterium]
MRWLALSLFLPSVVRADASVDALVAQLTLDEKLALVEGAPEPDGPDNVYQAGFLRGVPRLGIPPLRLTDGPPGVATRRPSTGMPCTMAVAATFSPRDAEDNGLAIGQDARRLGQDVVLEPFLNLDRDTSWGRGFNTFGEDPLLTAQIGAATIRGIQAQGVLAQAKHLLAFEGGYNVWVDEQTLHEVYLRPFEYAVNAGVASMMCAYNRLNGVPACGNASLLTQLLRNELGFRGFVTSDWAANHAGPYLNTGLDLEMPGPGGAAGDPVPTFFDAEALKQGLARGWLQESRLNEAVARILGQYARFGLLDGTRVKVTPIASAAIIQRTAEHAAVLLQNDGVLPLARAPLALIGAPARQTVATNGGGEKPGGLIARQLGAVHALRKRGLRVEYAVGVDLEGVPIPAEAYRELARDGQADAQIADVLPAGSSPSWRGTLLVPERGVYELNVHALGATARLRLDGRDVHWVGRGLAERPRYADVLPTDGNAPVPTRGGLANGRTRLTLEAGPHALEVLARADASGKPVQVRLAWVTPAGRAQDRTDAARAAARAKTALVFVWSSDDLSRPLPDDQDALIREVARANANTVVVLHTSQPVAMPWLADVRAVLQVWYPGDEGGEATANVLLGEAEPAGRLPFTWPRTIEQTLAHQREHPERSSEGIDGRGTCTAWGPNTGDDCGRTIYSEGVHVGYRFFDLTQQTPLYPFGYGLSYGSVAYSELRPKQNDDGSLSVRFALHNTSRRHVSTTPQVYLGAPDNVPPGVRFAARALAAFERVELAPGQQLTRTLTVPARLLQYWSSTYGWRTATGTRALYVGAHARDHALEARFTVTR